MESSDIGSNHLEGLDDEVLNNWESARIAQWNVRVWTKTKRGWIGLINKN